jgi:hypothetical protein
VDEIRLAVGIPTRNRAELAIAAVESVLRSDAPGVTAIVSDNSTDAAERERLRAFCAERDVHYLTPPEPLTMAPHWEWLRRAIEERIAPTHMTYLTDRMVFLDGALRELTSIVASDPGHVVSYQHDRVEDAEAPVQLVQAQWTGKLLELDAGKLIELSSRGEYGDYLPRMLNSIAPLDAMAAIERRFGHVFAPVSPDYGFAYRCLAMSDAIVLYDRACLIHYGMAQSAGVTFLRGKPNEHAAAFARSLSGPRFGATPEPRFDTVANAIFQEYCAVREEAGGDRFPPLERRGYLTANAISVSRIGDPEWRARLGDLLRQHGWTRRDEWRHLVDQTLRIASFFARHPAALARSLKRQLWDRPPGTPIAEFLSRHGVAPPLRDELKFDTAAAAIAHAARHPRRRTRYGWPLEPLERAGAVRRRLDAPR